MPTKLGSNDWQLEQRKPIGNLYVSQDIEQIEFLHTSYPVFRSVTM
jgi:hypothetical protein